MHASGIGSPFPILNPEATMPRYTSASARWHGPARAFAGAMALALIVNPVAFASGAGDMAKPSLEGTWTLKSAYDLHKDGTKTFGFGPKPTGILMVDKYGRYSLQIFRSNEPTYATDSQGMRTTFKPNEIASTHYGVVSLDPTNHTVTFHIELAYISRWNGTDQVRPYTLSGDELSYQVPPQPGSDSVAVSVWRHDSSTDSASRP
ncbi:lipocalin-like domain-containing protein [Dyella sp. 20L07]|uniref:lipocalin-like domain-containing protein n=1 Tax=Dyella sp. 20L07 TaxID=3384240 RepID=UPI003D2A2FA9